MRAVVEGSDLPRATPARDHGEAPVANRPEVARCGQGVHGVQTLSQRAQHDGDGAAVTDDDHAAVTRSGQAVQRIEGSRRYLPDGTSVSLVRCMSSSV